LADQRCRPCRLALTERLKPEADFDDFAQATVAIAGELYGNGGEVQRILAGAWSDVGLKVPLFACTSTVHTPLAGGGSRLPRRSGTFRSGVSVLRADPRRPIRGGRARRAPEQPRLRHPPAVLAEWRIP
jgi:hypothetical protein